MGGNSGKMINVLDFGLSSLASSVGWGSASFSWHVFPHAHAAFPLLGALMGTSTFNAGKTLQWAILPSGEECFCPPRAMKTRISYCLMGHILNSNAEFTILHFRHFVQLVRREWFASCASKTFLLEQELVNLDVVENSSHT